MPSSQSILNFPNKKTRACQAKSADCYLPNRRNLLVAEESATPTRSSARCSNKEAKIKIATAVYTLEATNSDESPKKPSKSRVQSHKRKQDDPATPCDVPCSPRKSPCKNFPVVSPIRLKAFRGTYMTVSKANKTASVLNDESQEDVTSDSSDDEITISCNVTPIKKRSLAYETAEMLPSLQKLEEDNCLLPFAPFSSPANQISTLNISGQTTKLTALSPTKLCSKLSNLVSSVKKCEPMSNDKENSPSKSCSNKVQTPKKNLTPKKCDGHSRHLFSPLKENRNNLKSPLKVIKFVNSVNGCEIQEQVVLKQVKVNVSDILKTKVEKETLKPLGEVEGLSDRNSDSNTVPVNIGLLSPVKTSKVSLNTHSFVHDKTGKAVSSPLKRLDPAHAHHLRSPLKQLQASSRVAPDSPLRRSPRKHDLNSSPGRTLLSPVKKLSLGSTCPIQVHKPNVSCYQAVRRALSHTMPVLVGRETEVSSMTNLIKTCLQEKKPGAMYISGAPGTGKTAALTHILDTLTEVQDLAPVWVNCMGLQGSNAVFNRISKELSLPQQPTELKTLRTIERHFSKKGKSIVLVLDEVDQLETRHQELLYTIFEWPALQGSRLLLLAIANRLDLTERVLPRLAVAGNCAPHRLHFPPYTKAQIVEILTDRLNKSGVEWRSVIRPPALQLLAGKVASVAGDARRALDVCRRAVETCQTKAQQSTLVPCTGGNRSVVDMACILKIFNEVYGSRVVTALAAAPASFPLQQKILLCCLLLVHKHAKLKHTTMGKLQEIYTLVCSHRQMPAVESSEFMSLCCNLETRAMIVIGKSKDIRMAKVSLSLNPDEAERALADRELILQILEDTEALGRLAKKK
ncbi:Cdc6 C-terminal [Trinorchestia longiramus]|nr:Cdc6 C-terminal [Trinorchestia longiramus]